MGRSEALIGVFAQKQIPPSTASRLPIPAFAHCAPAFIGARGSASQARLFTPFFKGGKKPGGLPLSATFLFKGTEKPGSRLLSIHFATTHKSRRLRFSLAPFDKGGGHCSAMDGDLRLRLLPKP